MNANRDCVHDAAGRVGGWSGENFLLTMIANFVIRIKLQYLNNFIAFALFQVLMKLLSESSSRFLPLLSFFCKQKLFYQKLFFMLIV